MNIEKCKCGSNDASYVLTEGKVVCLSCLRSGERTWDSETAWAAWNADRLAERKAREALRPFAEMAPAISGSGASLLGNGIVVQVYDKYINGGNGGHRRVRVGDFNQAAEALALLGKEADDA